MTTLSPELQEQLVVQAKTHAFRLGHPSAPVFTQRAGTPVLLFLRAKGEADPVQGLYELDLTTGAEVELIKPEQLTAEGELSAEEKARRERQRIAAKGFVAFSVSSDGAHILLPYGGKLFVYERASQRVHAIEGSEGALDPQLSPDGKQIAFVKDYDVWIATLGERARPLTKGGTEERPHGLAEFAAQEEFARSRGFFFAPDGKTIAVQYTDQSQVQRLTLADPVRPEKAPERPYYPRAGTKNAEVRFQLIDVKTGQARAIEWDQKQFPYVATARWDKHGPFTLYVLDRAQREGRLLAVDAQTGKARELLAEHDEAWLNVDPSVPRFRADGGFVWSSEKSGHWVLTLHAADGKPVRTLVDASRGYRGVVALDQKDVLCNGGAEPTLGTVLRVSLDDGALQPVGAVSDHLIDARAAGQGHVLLADASLTSWPRYRVVGGAQEREVRTTFGTPAALPTVRSLRLGQSQVRALLISPKNTKPGERLPVIDAAYGGPHVNLAVHNALSLARAQWMADAVHAFVVILDAEGTPHRGRAWERPLYGKLGAVPLSGHKAALTLLGAQVPEADLSRVGMYGWSFGGYLSALAALREPGFFKAAMAGAPPVDWRDYDTAYTERYLGHPDVDTDAYDAASLLTWAKHAGPSAPLLLVHGTADDNVYFLNSLKLADALTRAHKTYEFLPLANITHMLWDEERYVGTWSRAAAFFREHLAGEK